MHRQDSPPDWAASFPGCAWHKGTLEDPGTAEVLKWKPDAVIHSAWIATPGVYLESEENEGLREQSLNMLTDLAKGGVKHHTVLGTCIEYQMTGEPLVENVTPLAPIHRYAKAKNGLREDLEAALPPLGATLAWARVFYPYGAGEHHLRLCSSLIKTLRAGDALRLKTPHSTKDYIHVKDIAHALLTITEQAAAGPYNLGTGEGVSVYNLAMEIGKALGRPDLVLMEPTGQADPYAFVVADSSRLRSQGWTPRVSLAEGISEMIEGRPAN